jgi:glycosyltransferase involved in cell wall biosynthesis
MNGAIKVSVICLTHNHEKYIRQALLGIVNQNVCFNYEIIVCDDASTDKTKEIVEEFMEQHPGIINIINNEIRVGGAMNAYKAMKLARGEYIASCEGDDFWIDTHKLQEQVEFLDENPSFVGCTHDVLLVKEDGSRRFGQHVSWISKKRVYGPKDFKGLYLPGHGSTWVRRNLYLVEGFDGSFIVEADKNIADRTNVLLWLAYGDFYKMKGKKSAYRIGNKKNSSVTTELYKRGRKGILYDYNYTKNLEYYAQENMDIAIDFTYQKMNLFAKAILKCLVERGSENKRASKLIFEEARCKVKYLLYLPYFMFKKVICVLIRGV